MDDSIAASRAAHTAWEIARKGTLFDHDYNLADTSQMYCTELVEFAYRKADICLSEGRRTQINVPAMGGTYLMPDDIAANKRLKYYTVSRKLKVFLFLYSIFINFKM